MTQISKKDYKRAEKFLAWNALFLVSNSMVRPNWINDKDKFWYEKDISDGYEYVIFDPVTQKSQPAFDHDKLASSMSKILNRKISPSYLPLKSIKFSKDERILLFSSMKKKYSCDLTNYHVQEQDEEQKSRGSELVSPDGQWALTIKDHNLVVRSTATDEVTQLTIDGEKHHDYATSPECNTHTIMDRLSNKPLKPIAIWSPDSVKIVTLKIDQRKVKDLHLLQAVPTDGTSRPILHTYKYAFPNDLEIPTGEIYIFDLLNKSKLEWSHIKAKHKPFPIMYWSIIEYNWMWWSKSGEFIFFVFIERYHEVIKFYELNVQTGELRVLLEETGNTFLEARNDRESGKMQNIRMINQEKEIIWWSSADRHLYLYDRTNCMLKNQITAGDWVVREIKHVDEEERMVYFSAGGREKESDPYYQYLYRVYLDGSGLELLTPETAEHDVLFAPTGNFFVDRYSRVDSPPVSVVRSKNGELIKELGKADISKLLNKGWILPKPIKTISEDGKTDIYGAIFFPTTFDPNKKYPILDYIYPGPQRIHVPKAFPQIDYPSNFLFFWNAQAFAELGFIVIIVDGRGTPYRSKKFHDFCYGDLYHSVGLKDHVAAIQQLEQSYGYMDLNKVGIFGHSSGGSASARAILEYPDFFKVAVSSAGNHDHLSYLVDWSEKYMGSRYNDLKAASVNSRLARKLKGKLLLVNGELDDNCHFASMMSLINALINANKDFDMLTLPNRDHLFLIDPYFIRRRWDYFIRHLLGQEPPKNVKIKGIDPNLLRGLIGDD